MAGEIPIDKGRALPPSVRPKYPFATMEVGDSFAYDGKATSAYSLVVEANKRYAPRRWTVRTQGETRIWRVA